ncbi:hypothetical protein GF415_03115 [Candidatus Micrarchaeota archaeon]|nr:hypothetical protein [Candidatus Micrarchaeota archaeon]
MKRIAFAVAFVALVLVSGCVSIGLEQELNKDGTSLVTEEIDLSGFISAASEMGNDSSTSASDFEEMALEACEPFQDDPETECTYSLQDYTLTVSKEITPEEGGYTFTQEADFPNVKYVFQTDQLPKIDVNLELGGEAGGEAEDMEEETIRFTDSDAPQTAASMKMMSVDITYTIIMPGEITEARNGIINDEGEAVYDVLDLMEEKQTIKVTSEESDPIGALCGPAFVLLAILGASLFSVSRE